MNYLCTFNHMQNNNKRKSTTKDQIDSFLDYNRHDHSPDASVIEKWAPIWRLISNVCQSAVFVYDCFTKKFIYVSEYGLSPFGLNVDALLSEGRNAMSDVLHPEDSQTLMLLRKKVFKFLQGLPADEVKDYKTVHEFRFRKTDGQYARLTEQEHVIELDKDGNIWLTLSILNMDAGNETEPVKSHIYKMNTGEQFKVDLADTLIEALTPREKEILLLISEGLLSKEISARLGISVNTVSVHRQHIFTKLDCDNAMEAVKQASALGILS